MCTFLRAYVEERDCNVWITPEMFGHTMTVKNKYNVQLNVKFSPSDEPQNY